VSAPAAGTHPAGDTVAGALAGRYPYLTPGQCGLLEAVLLSGLASAAGRDCALAAVRPQLDGSFDISIGGGTVPRTNCPLPGGFPPPQLPEREPPR
jgi:hypothetical protein